MLEKRKEGEKKKVSRLISKISVLGASKSIGKKILAGKEEKKST